MRCQKTSLLKFAVLGLFVAAIQIDRSSADCLIPYWQPLSPAQSPLGQRFYHQMASDSKRGKTVLFGGADKCYKVCQYPTDTNVYNDTWEFDGKTWTQQFPNTIPLRLLSASMSYDPVRGVTIMFGGIAGLNGFPNSSILWEWDGNDWTEFDNTGPAARYGHKMVYDSVRHVHVMYGGFVYSRRPGDTRDMLYPVTETWEYAASGRIWTLRSTNGPPARFDFNIAFDAARNRTVLFGGRLETAPTLAQEYANDTWVWDGGAGTWQQLNPANKPSGRFGHSMAFDSTRSVVVLLGGQYVKQDYGTSIVPGLSSETWTWDGANWSNQTLFFDFPSGVFDAPMVYESARQQLFMFADTGPTLNDPMLNWVRATGNGRTVNFVDSNNRSGIEDGSGTNPFRTVRSAASCASGATTISIRSGDYPEGALTLSKQVAVITTNGWAHIH